jgi:Ca2+-binding EF-hand superfamily protein
MILELDAEGNGCVDFNGFLRLMKRKMSSVGQVKDSSILCNDSSVTEAFCVLDKDKDGYVSPAEFMLVMRVFGHKAMTEKDAAAALKEADMDGDGRVSLKDLLTFARQNC